MSVPTFSVVIPAYNAPATIGPAIESVLAQTRSELELIVVDDGSSDETPEVVAGYEKSDERVRLVRQANAGVAGARNTGIARAGGEFVSFLDNDDLWLPRYLELMGAALDADERAGFAYTDGWTLDHATRRIFVESTMSATALPGDPPRDTEGLMIALVRANFVLSSATVRKRVLDEVGGFDPAIGGVDDYDLWLRIVAAGHLAARVPGRLVIQRERSDSQSKDEFLMGRGLRDVMDRAAADERLPPEARREAARQRSRWDRVAAAAAGGRSPGALAIRLRRAAGRARRALLPGPAICDEPPPDVAEAFPDLWKV